MSKTHPELEDLEKIRAKVEALPDEHDGLNLTPYKRAALMAADQFRANLAAVLKLAS